MKFFEFTKKDYEYIVNECMFDEEYQKLLEYKIKGYTVIKIADLLGKSESATYEMIKKLKRKINKIM